MTTAIDRLSELIANAPPDRLAVFLSRFEGTEEATVLQQALKIGTQRADEDDWAVWLPTLFPSYFSVEFAEHHAQLWEWVWSINLGVKPENAFIACWARGGAKSTSAEAAVVALGARKRRRYVVYVCHAKGTPILAEHGWQPVEDHPTAAPRLVDRTLRVSLAGVPFEEVVTPEHRYWARRVARRDHGKAGAVVEIRRTRPNWCEADDLDWNTWLGLPIDSTVEDVAPTFSVWKGHKARYVDEPCAWADDPEFWWVVGLWWGDGTRGGSRNQQISWSMADAHPELRVRLVAALTKFGLNPAIHQHKTDAVANVSACHAAFSRWLGEWRVGRNSRKTPPDFVERLPLHKQAALMRGYLDADGYVEDRAASIASVHLEGLFAGRRMLARLGIPSGINRTHPERASTIRGRTYMVQAGYRLRFVEGVEVLGIRLARPPSANVRDFWIDDGCLWSRVRNVTENGPEVIVPIQTESHDYLTAFARSHNCETQPQADDHVGNIGSMLESEQVGRAYPSLGDRAVGKFGSSKGWRRNRLRTSDGFIVDALGLDVASRGMKIDEERPDLIVFDDIDDTTDGPGQVEKKIVAITTKLLPAGSSDVAVLGIQNLVHANGVFGHLVGTAEVDDQSDFLTNRIVSGPIPAIQDATFDRAQDGGWKVIAGEPSWQGQNLATCQAQIDEWGYTAFLAEAQHDTDAKGGGMFDHIVFAHCKRDAVPALTRVEVWCDPAVTNTDKSDSMAVQCDGLGVDKTIYRLRSWERRATPIDAIKLAICWAFLEGSRTVGIETDQGGDTWRSVYKEALGIVRADLTDAYAGGGTAGIPEYVQAMAELSGREARTLIDPHFAEAKAGSTRQPKEHRIQQMLTKGYESAGAIVHVLGTHAVLERGLFRFPARKPYDICDAAYWAWLHISAYGQPVRTSAPAARARSLPKVPLVKPGGQPTRGGTTPFGKVGWTRPR